MNRVSIKCLGNMGRFGNQLWQYAFAKSYALHNGYELEVPENWIGRLLFNIDDPVISSNFPRLELDDMPDGNHSIDLYGYYQHQRYADTMNADTVRSFFTFKDEWVDRFPKIKPYYIACHMRRGDYINNPNYCVVEKESYEKALDQYGYDLEHAIFVGEEIKYSSDSRNYHSDKTYYGNIDFLYDFFLLLNSDVLFRSNSTFGWWASFLSPINQKTYSPLIQGYAGQKRKDVKFVLGNYPCHQEIDNRHSDLIL